MCIYLYHGQLYANKTRPEMNRAYCMFMHQVDQCQHELLNGGAMIRAMQSQNSALKIYSES